MKFPRFPCLETAEPTLFSFPRTPGFAGFSPQNSTWLPSSRPLASTHLCSFRLLAAIVLRHNKAPLQNKVPTFSVQINKYWTTLLGLFVPCRHEAETTSPFFYGRIATSFRPIVPRTLFGLKEGLLRRCSYAPILFGAVWTAELILLNRPSDEHQYPLNHGTRFYTCVFDETKEHSPITTDL